MVLLRRNQRYGEQQLVSDEFQTHLAFSRRTKPVGSEERGKMQVIQQQSPVLRLNKTLRIRFLLAPGHVAATGPLDKKRGNLWGCKNQASGGCAGRRGVTVKEKP